MEEDIEDERVEGIFWVTEGTIIVSVAFCSAGDVLVVHWNCVRKNVADVRFFGGGKWVQTVLEDVLFLAIGGGKADLEVWQRREPD